MTVLADASTQTSRILDGRRIAEELLDDLKVRVDARLAAGGARPGLAVVLVGGDPASSVYVRNKRRAAEKVGIEAFDYDLPEGTSEAQLLELIDQLNADPKIHGILIQLPLPGIPDANRLIQRIDPRKDVDGFHPQNVGHLVLREFGLRPCTPRGITTLLGFGLWWRARRQPAILPTVQTGPSPRTLLDDLKRACQANDTQATRQALDAWARQQPETLAEMAARFAPLSEALDGLNGALYSETGQHWQGTQLWEAIRSLPPLETPVNPNEPSPLPPLYPR